ncbi:MAG: DUF1934 family protein [Erysipelotrichaceae bacterium]|nr:DUF1934 family protein [Erysipelotrichaceae bacterium]
MYNAMEMSDEMKKCKIQMTRRSNTQRDIDEKKSYIAALTEEDDTLTLQYWDENKSKFTIIYDGQSVQMQCQAETRSTLNLVLNTWTDVEITTPFGNMLLRSRALKITRSKHHLLVCYELHDGNEQIDVIEIKWDLFWDSIS